MSGESFAALCICGPTSAGKSACAVAVAEALDGEIVNADSRQIYAAMRIGTGWPSVQAMQRIPHHMYGSISPTERYSAGRFVEDAGAAIRSIALRGRLPILVGGTGLYVEALGGTMPMDRPIGDETVRARVRAESIVHPHEALRDWLSALDPSAAQRVRPGDRYRTLRALEAALARRHALREPTRLRAHDIRLNVMVLTVSRDVLRRRIRARVDEMLDAGIVAEALAVRARWPDAPALTGIGFAEAIAYADGATTLAETRERIVLRTSRYASRQATWFRRMRGAIAIDASDIDSAARAVTAAARESSHRA